MLLEFPSMLLLIIIHTNIKSYYPTIKVGFFFENLFGGLKYVSYLCPLNYFNMKNIYVLPTNKPSRLCILSDGILQLKKIPYLKSYPRLSLTNQHIYITSDEEIKLGEYGKLSTNHIWRFNEAKLELVKEGKIEPKKIILTTDPDLIKEGVQAIDDEFLEWFVKNSSCERVETYSLGIENSDTGESGHYKYEIIIPKEELKQRFLLFDKEKADAITNEGRKIVRELQNTIQQETIYSWNDIGLQYKEWMGATNEEKIHWTTFVKFLRVQGFNPPVKK